MSDPVTNAEVEDVLSSIRRLVSEEKRPKQPAQPKDAADRLVLTPALRVEDEEAGEHNETKPQADPPRTHQDTVGETAKQLFDPSDDMPSDVYNRRIGADFGWSGEDEALFDDLVADEGGEEATSTTDPAKMPVFRHDEHADDYSEDPYGFSDEAEDEEETGLTDDASDLPPAVVSENPPHVAEGDFDAPAEEVDAVDDTLEAESDTETEEEAAEENDMFDFDLLAKRGQEAAARDQDLQEPEAPQTSADAPDEDRQAGMVAASKAATLSAKIAALETAIGNIADTWEPDTPGTDDYSGTDQPAMAWEDDVSHDATGLPLRSEAAQAAWQEAHPDVVMIGTARAAAAAAAAQEERAAEMRSEGEAREARTRDIAAEDQAARDRAIATARAAAAERVAADKRAAEQREESRAQAEADARAAATAHQTPIEHTPAEDASSTAEEGLDYADDSQLLDEEALRDIVSEIVRAELQGALGERITRNVRKLVRREIHRALTAQELE